MLSPSILCAEETRKKCKSEAGTRNLNVNTKHFLGGGWEEGRNTGREEVRRRKPITMILANVTNTTTADYWVQIKINT